MFVLGTGRRKRSSVSFTGHMPQTKWMSFKEKHLSCFVSFSNCNVWTRQWKSL